jgi:hypothetical protein
VTLCIQSLCTVVGGECRKALRLRSITFAHFAVGQGCMHGTWCPSDMQIRHVTVTEKSHCRPNSSQTLLEPHSWSSQDFPYNSHVVHITSQYFSKSSGASLMFFTVLPIQFPCPHNVPILLKVFWSLAYVLHSTSHTSHVHITSQYFSKYSGSTLMFFSVLPKQCPCYSHNVPILLILFWCRTHGLHNSSYISPMPIA